MKRLIAFLLYLCLLSFPVYAQEPVSIDEFSGANFSTDPDKLADGEHARFTNLYIDQDNIRTVKGRDKLTTTAAGDTTVNGIFYYERAPAPTTTALWHCDTPSHLEDAAEGLDFTANGGAGSSTTKKFGTSSCDLTGAADYFSHSDNDAWFIEDQYTIDFWMRFDTVSADHHIWGQRQVGNFQYSFVWDQSATDFVFLAENSSVTHNLSWNYSASAGTFVHIAWVKDGDDFEVFVDGVSLGTETDSSTLIDLNGGVNFGRANLLDGTTNVGFCDCKLDEIRISKGEAVYTTNFTPETAAYTVEFDTGSQKIVVAESDDLVVYDLDGTNRSVIKADVSDTPWDFMQVDTALYATNTQDGQYKWFGDTTVDASRNANAPSFPLIEEYKGVVMVAQNRTLQFSNDIGEDETNDETYGATDRFTVGINTGLVTDLQKTSNSLIIFTESSIQELTGFGSTFELRNLVLGLGAINHNTVKLDTNGDIIFFAGTLGVYKLQVGRQLTDTSAGVEIDRTDTTVAKLSAPLDDIFTLENTDEITLASTEYADSHAYYDLENDLYFLYVGDDCLIYDNIEQSWTHVPATEMTGSVYAYSTIQVEPKAFLTDNVGFLWENWKGYENGVETGTVTGTATAGTSTTITDSTAIFDTTDDGLAGVWVYLDNEDPEYRQITSNTATVLTVDSAFTTTPIADDTYYIGYIRTDLLTKQYNYASPPKRSLNDFFWIFFNPAASEQILEIFGFGNKRTKASRIETIDLSNTDRFEKIGMSMRGFWLQFGLRSFIYNTSDTIDPPVDIVSYAFKGTIEQED